MSFIKEPLSLSHQSAKRRRFAYSRLLGFTVAISSFLFFLILLTAKLQQEWVQNIQQYSQRLVCYYDSSINGSDGLRLADVPGDLCTHINIGVVDVQNASLVLTSQLKALLEHELPKYHILNPNVKILLWIGGGGSGKTFSNMVVNHAQRKRFILSVKQVLNSYQLDGIDLDWEFPSAYNKDRQHLSQLIFELRQEWRRERRDCYLLSLAVAAPEGIALFAYDVSTLNKYVDYVNIMSYDFHFFTKATPFTGLNAPLYARSNEGSILATVNINYTVHWWLSNGLEAHRLVVGLPTYGHSFTLVNPFNSGIGAPASGIGTCGRLGFTTYSETCRCEQSHLDAKIVFDNQTCSPYMSANDEWISYENPVSMHCKATYIKSLNVGGAMVFSLNTDDVFNYCGNQADFEGIVLKTFPLIETVKKVFSN